ncbi:MAG: beta-ketoacyl synthase N-terminal-like domain-containing protein, partial [Bacteroidota bacterium]
MDYKNLNQLLEHRAQQSDKGILFVRSTKEEHFLSYTSLFQQSRKVLSYFKSHGLKEKDYLIFQVPKQEDFIVAFWACLLGGIIPVPVVIGNNDEHRLKLFNIWKTLPGSFLLTDSTRFGWIEKYAQQQQLAIPFAEMSDRKIALERLYEADEEAEVFDASPEHTAFIQFSSGSTGKPKGVIMKHHSLLVNTRSLGLAFKSPTGVERIFSWMPLTHDMGLIGFHLTPVFFDWFHGIMSTDLFIRRPYLWLNKVSEHQISITSSPNFGYEYVSRLYDAKQYAKLDLSKVRIILNGAEPISRKLCHQFEALFTQHQLAKNVILPGYGLAEATLTVSVAEPGAIIIEDWLDPKKMLEDQAIQQIAPSEEAVSVTCVGEPTADVQVRIAGSNDRVLADDHIGEIQLNGPAATDGYVNNEEANREVKTADGWTRTGDLGYMRDGRLYITGRKKDIIFVNGSNLYPHDLERVATELESITLGKVIVTSIRKQGYEQDSILAFIHRRQYKPLQFAQLALELRKKINDVFKVQLHDVIPVKAIPKTSSGKLQRYKLAQAYQQGEFTIISKQLKKAISKLDQLEKSFVPSNKIERKMTAFWKKILELPNIAPDDKFFELGGDSLKAAELATLIIEEFELEDDITTNTILEFPTINALVELVHNKLKQKGSAIPDLDIETEEEVPQETPIEIAEGDVAVIGMSIRFPGANNLDEFWDNLKEGRESIQSFSKEELLDSGLTEEEIDNEQFINKSGILADADCFDAPFFGYTPTEASRMSPQMRVYHECVWSALENSGYNPEQYEGRIGLFTGASSNLVWDTSHFLRSGSDAEEFQSFIYNTDYTSTRVSYKLNLKGPSFTFNTACSSSLVAIQLAYRSILSGESDMAIGGGVSVFDKLGYEYQEGMIMSADGRCRAFDEQADGTIRGSGVGVVVLK